MSAAYDGRLEGRFDVDANGGATYAIAIAVPPGTAGLQPSLQLVYNSHLTELGFAGAAWRLSGLSSITRVAATIAQDGFIGRVEFGANDRFALDGARLVSVEGEYGGANAVYRTEVEQWMKVVPKASTVAGCSGPQSFVSYAKDRTRYEFGGTEDSRVLANTAPGKPANASVRIWNVSRITDRNGNYMTFRYDRDTANNAAYPVSIAYGGNEQTGAQPQREVRFTYTALPDGSPDAAPQFAGGYATAAKRLLETISTYVNGQLVLTYRLAYTRDGVTRRSRVASVTLADRDGRTLPATTFTWQDAPASFFGRASGITLAAEVRGTFIPMDVNGDGIIDIVNAYAARGDLALDLYLGRPDGTFEEAVPIPTSGLKSDAMLFPLDVDADGCTDLVYARGERDELTMTVFHARQIDGRWTLKQGPAGGGGPAGLRWPAAVVSLDFDGDGRIDLVHCSGERDRLVIRPLRSNGTAFVHEPGAKTVTDLPWSANAHLIPLDYDGDGRGDLVYGRADRDMLRVRLLRSDGTRFVAEAADAAIGDVPYTRLLFGMDANGDGKPDLIAARLHQGTLELRTLLSNGIGLEPAQLSTFAVRSEAMPRLLPARVSGGLADLIVQSVERDALTVRVLSSDGARFVERTNVAQPFPGKWLGGTLLPADVDGDGRTDLLAIGRASADDRRVRFTAARVTGPIPDLVQRVTDGYGLNVSIEYKPLTDSSVYRKGELAPDGKADPRALLGRGVTGATFDLVGRGDSVGTAHSTMSVQFAKQVVSAYERPGAGTQRFRFERFYSGARVDLQGRGWLGFATMTAGERGRDTRRVTSYRQDFPFAGTPSSDELRRVSDDRLFERTTFEHSARVSGKVHEPQLRKQSRAVFGGPDASGTADMVESTEYEYDVYGNRTLESTRVTGAASRPLFVHHIYGEYDPAAWKLGVQLQKKVTSDKEGGTLLQHRCFTYDARGNRMSDGVWDERHSRWLTTRYEHDGYGNETAVTTASGATSRTEYDALHTFPARTTNPANEAGVALITTHEHDPAFGVEIATSQPHLPGDRTPRVKAKQQLDGLGRVAAKLGPAPGGGLVTLKKFSRGKDALGPFEEEQALEDWAGTLWRRERRYLTPSGGVFRTSTLGPDGKRDVIVEHTLDSDGRSIEETLLRYEGTPSRHVRRTYDELGRLVRLERPLAGGATAVAETRCISATVEVSTEGVGTSAPRVTRREYGSFNGKRLIVKRVDALGGETSFDYDPLARSVRGVDPNGVVTTAAYDFADRQVLLEVRSGDRLQTAERVEHDDVERETVRIDGRGARIRLRHDGLNRLVRKGPDGGESTIYTWDDAANARTFSRLARVTMPGGLRTDYDYDDLGNRTVVAVTLDGASHALRSSFTPAARAERVVYPDGSVVKNVFNAAGSLLAIEDGDGSRYAEYGDFSPFGKAQSIALLNGTRESVPYNDVGQLSGHSITGGNGAELARASVRWNELYQLEQIEDHRDPTKTQSFGYDVLGRLLHARGDYGTPQEFGYDRAGNLIRKGAVEFTVEGHQVRRGVSGGGEVFRADYDAAGNVTRSERAGEQHDFHFDAHSQLIEANGTKFVYDHDGVRVAKRSAGGATTYSLSRLFEITVFPDGARQSTIYIEGPHGLVASKTKRETAAPAVLLKGVPAPGLYFFHTNHINSTTVQTDADGAEACRVEYLPFGEVHRMTGRDIIRQKFTGNELDYETGLYYFKSRYYDAFLGRFISADDRLGGEMDRHDVFNRYAYVLNNPVSDFDPEGHSSGWAIFAGVAFGLAAVAGVALTIVSAGAAAPAVATGLSLLGGVVAGGAASGAVYSFTHTNNFDATRLGIEIGIGAAVGVLGTGVSTLGMKALGVAVQFGVSSASAALTLAQAGRMAVVETISGFAVGAAFASLQQAADRQSFNLKDVATKAGWGAAGGLVAGGVLGGAVRAAQRPAARFSPELANLHYIPAPSNVFALKAVQGLVHLPRGVFGSLARSVQAAV